METKKLYRSRQNRVLGGVCGGIGEYLNVDPLVVRIVFVIFAMPGGFAVLAYILMWLFIPEEPVVSTKAEKSEEKQDVKEEKPETKEEKVEHHHPTNANLIFGAILIVAGLMLLARSFFPFFSVSAYFWPIALLLIGVWLISSSVGKK